MDEKKYERILAWLEGAMTHEERSNFEEEMRRDNSLAEEAEIAKAAFQAQNETEVHSMRKQLNDIMAEPLPSPKTNVAKMAMAIVLFLGLCTLLFYFLRNEPQQKKQPLGPVAAYQKYFSLPEPELELNTIYSMKRDEVENDSFRLEVERLASEVNEAYTMNSPEKVLLLIEEINGQDSIAARLPVTKLMLFEGIALLHTGNAQAASDIFDEINEIRYDENAQWYKAGSMLSLNRTQEAIAILEEIASIPTHPKNKMAKKLMSETGVYPGGQ